MGNFSVKWQLFVEAFVQNEGYIKVLEGLQNTIIIAICGLLIGIIIGTILALIKVVPQYKLHNKFFTFLANVYVSFFRGTPIVVQLLLSHYVLAPLLGISPINNLLECVVIFGLNSGAYVSEIMRSGINSVDKGQLEAGRAVGLSYGITMIKIVIPQAIKNIIPTLGNEFISLIKETSIVSFVGAFDLYTAFDRLASGIYDWMVPFLIMALIYISIIMLITLLIKIIERVLSKSDKTVMKKSLVKKWGWFNKGGNV